MTGVELPSIVRRHVADVERACADQGAALVSLVLFGSAAKGDFSDASDVDLIAVIADDSSPAVRRAVRTAITAVEIANGFRPAAAPGRLKARIDRAAGHLFPCPVCTRADLLSGDIGRVLGLKWWEAALVDRIVLATIVASATTVWGEDLVPRVCAPPVRRIDVYKAMIAFCAQIVLSLQVFPLLPDATRYAMGALKHSLHSCFFCYHAHGAQVDEEVAFFERRLGPQRALRDLMALRRAYRPSLAFVLRCASAIPRLHLATARDNRFVTASAGT